MQSFTIDKGTAALLQSLQGTFGVNSNAGVIRSAIGLAKIAARHVTDEKSILIKGSTEADERAETILLDR